MPAVGITGSVRPESIVLIHICLERLACPLVEIESRNGRRRVPSATPSSIPRIGSVWGRFQLAGVNKRPALPPAPPRPLFSPRPTSVRSPLVNETRTGAEGWRVSFTLAAIAAPSATEAACPTDCAPSRLAPEPSTIERSVERAPVAIANLGSSDSRFKLRSRRLEQFAGKLENISSRRNESAMISKGPNKMFSLTARSSSSR